MTANDIIEDIGKLTADIEKKLLLLRCPEYCKTPNQSERIEKADHELRTWYKKLPAIIGDNDVSR